MSFPLLQSGDTVEIIAPSGKCDPEVLTKTHDFLQDWGLKAHIPDGLLGEDLLCANTDEKRLQALEYALYQSEAKVIWPARGGYGCTKLLAFLDKLPAPKQVKWIMGFSDITAFHIYVQNRWNWPSLHCISTNQVANQLVSKESIEATKALLLKRADSYEISLKPMNQNSAKLNKLSGVITGGNLALVIASIGTSWQIRTDGKFLLLEDINEPAFRIDRMLVQLEQVGLLKNIKGLFLGDFTEKQESNMNEQVKQLLSNWAHKLNVPVLKIPVGHATSNQPVPLNYPCELITGDEAKLIFYS